MFEKSQICRTDRRTLLQSFAATMPLVWAVNPSAAAEQTSTETLSGGIGPTLIEADEDAGFNFPYYLYAPPSSREKPLLVEIVNSGDPSDDIEHHIEAAEFMLEGDLARTISDELTIPLVVPVIKDPDSDDFWEVRTQSLDTETLNIDSGRYARIDQQVLSMVDDARDRLSEHGIDAPSEFILNGFSQSGNFANNLAALHPERIRSVTAGGINGMGILPLETAENERLDYQIGIADLPDLIGEEFDEDTWRSVPQLCYIGANERAPTDDTIPWRDVWSEEQARQAVQVYGDDMQRERMVYSDVIYQQKEADARFEVYDGVGHDTSAPKIVKDVLAFHKRQLELPYVMVHRGLTSGADELDVEVYVPGEDSETVVVKASIGGIEVTEESVPIRQGVSNRITLELSSTADVGDTLEIGVYDAENTAEEIYTEQHEIVVRASFETTPERGDSSVDVQYEATEQVQLELATDNGTLYWQRNTELEQLHANDSGTSTFELSSNDEGVPFRNGDTLVLRAGLPAEPEKPSWILDTVTVGDSNTTSVDTDIGEMPHDEVTLSFNSPPTVDSDTIDIECSVDSSFDQPITLSLFPETGTGRSGINGDWSFESEWKDFDRVQPGETISEEFDVPSITFASSDTQALGANVELRAYPENWGELTDFVAATNTVISGVQFTEPPTEGAETVAVEYVYPDRYDEDGELRLVVDSESVAEVADITPGTMDSYTFDIQETSNGMDALPAGADVTVELGPSGGEQLDATTRTARPDGMADISFAVPPEATTQHLTVEYELDAEFETDRFATLRLYAENTSKWGVYLQQITPGEAATEEIEINSNEVCVPFQEGDEVTVALVDWDDPYANLPLATATTRVQEDVEDLPEESEEDDGAADQQETDEADDHREDDDQQAEDEATEQQDAEDEDDDSVETEEEVPGFTVPSAVAGLGGLGYLLKRRLGGNEE